MDLSLTALSLSQGETEFLSLEGVDDVGGENTFELSLIGRFLTDHSINFNFMRDRLSYLWRPGKGVCISELANQRYIFKFFHVVDLKSVGINDIHCHLLLEESKGQAVQRLACQTLVS